MPKKAASPIKMSRRGDFTEDIKHHYNSGGSSSSLQESSSLEFGLARSSTDVQRSDVSMESPLRLHVSNIPFRYREYNLAMLFRNFGDVLETTVIYTTRGSKGFGFVTMARGQDAVEAMKMLNNTVLEGRVLRVNLATPKRRFSQVQAELTEAETRLAEARLEVRRIREELNQNISRGVGPPQLDL